MAPHGRYYTRVRKPYPTNLTEDELRLVALQPGCWTDPITCELFRASFLPTHSIPIPAYQALSYAWGIPSRKPPRISVNGCSFEVTVNLECALRHLRMPDKPLHLWVDAICINQEDPVERSMQVSKMREIYMRATKVIIFLGSGRGNNQHGVSLHKNPGENIYFSGTGNEDDLIEQRLEAWKSSSPESPVTPLDIFCLLSILSHTRPSSAKLAALSAVPEARLTAIFEALRIMLTVRWWDRVWVVQEAVVAEDLIVTYGNVSAPWGMISDIAYAYSGHPLRPDNLPIPVDDVKVLKLMSHVVDVDRCRTFWREDQKLDILPLLRHFSSRKATDSRDKVFALLGLCDPNDKSLIKPNYSWGDGKVYKETVVSIISAKESMSALTGDLGRKNKQDLPSWVPDWSAMLDDYDRDRFLLYDLFNACGDVTCTVVRSSYAYRSKDDFITVPFVRPRRLRAETDKNAQFEENHLTDVPESLIRRELDMLAACLEATVGTEHLMPRRMSLVLSIFSREHTTFSAECLRLQKSCHRNGKHDIPSFANNCFVIVDPVVHGKRLKDCLEIRGKRIGTVVRKTEPIYSCADLTEVRRVLQGWLAAARRWLLDIGPEQDTWGEDFFFKFAQTLLSDTIVTPEGTKRLRGDHNAEVTAWMHKLLGSTSESSDSVRLADLETSPFTKAMQLSLPRRVFFIVDNGRFGLGPSSIADLDEVYVLPGGNLPFVLRSATPPTTVMASTYKLVGDCFMNDLQDDQLGAPNTRSILDFIFEDVLRTVQRDWQALMENTINPYSNEAPLIRVRCPGPRAITSSGETLKPESWLLFSLPAGIHSEEVALNFGNYFDWRNIVYYWAFMEEMRTERQLQEKRLVLV